MLKALQTGCETEPAYSPTGLLLNLSEKPRLQLVKGELPKNLRPQAIEDAVWSLIHEIDVMGDHVGFSNATLKSIAEATFLKRGGDFWLVEENGEVMAYALGSVCEDIDNKLTYHVPQAWVHPRYRRTAQVKEWWSAIRQRAQDCLCQHILVVSARNPKVFCRWFGNGMHTYASLLKEDL